MKSFIIVILVVASNLTLIAQAVSVTIDGSSPDPSALLDIQSTTSGLLIPRMTTAQRELVNSPAVGLLVFDTGSESFWFKETTGWVELRDGNIKSLADNDDDTRIQLEESVDEDIIRFDLAGQERWVMRSKSLEPSNTGQSLFIGVGAGASDNGTDNRNVAIGDSAFIANTSGSSNTAVGHSAMHENSSGYENTAVGYKSMYSNVGGAWNTVAGYRSLFQNTSGHSNAAVGYQALKANTTGDKNSAFGYNALYFNISGDGNSAGGYEALGLNISGKYNVAFGSQALYQNSSGNNNVAIGRGALFNNIDRSALVAIGDSSLYNNGLTAVQTHEASYNTAVGASALLGNTKGFANTAYGFKTMYANSTGFSNTAIGYQSLYANGPGYDNTANGYEALAYNFNGHSNTACGHKALRVNTEGHGNTGSGVQSLMENTSGDYNTAVGQAALRSNISGSYNTAFGYNADVSFDSLVNATAIGTNAVVSQSNSLVLGNNAMVGIGNSTPNELLSIGDDFGSSLGGNRISVGNSSDYSGFNLGEDIDNRAFILWNNGSNRLEMGTKSAGTSYGAFLVLKDGRVGVKNSSPLYDLHVGDGNINATNQSNTRMVVSDDNNDQRAAVLGLAKTSSGAKVEAQLEANGSTNAGPSVIIGAVTSHPLYIRTGNITRMAVTTNGNVGIGTSSPSTTLEVNGDVTATCGVLMCSDARYKHVDAPLSHVLEAFENLQGVYFHWDRENYPDKNFSEGRQIGIIAQDLEPYFPELVHSDHDGYKTVDYAKFTAVLLQGLKEQQSEIDQLTISVHALSNQNSLFEGQIKRLCRDIIELKSQTKRLPEFEQ